MRVIALQESYGNQGFTLAVYRKQYCCEITLMRLGEDYTTTVDRKESMTELSTHMSTAFDLLCPSLMIQWHS